MLFRVLLFFTASIAVGCSNEGDDIQIIVPEGFEGVIQIVVDGTDSGGYRHIDDRHEYTIPRDGILHVETGKPFESWHGTTVVDSAGNLIDVNDPQRTFRGFGATSFSSDGDKTVHYIVVGSPQFIGRVEEWSYESSFDDPPSSEYWPIDNSID